MLNKLFLSVILLAISFNGYSQELDDDTAIYHYDTLIEYDEIRSNSNKSYKRYFFVNKSNPKYHAIAYKKDSLLILSLKGAGPPLKMYTSKDSLMLLNEIVLNVEKDFNKYNNPLSFVVKEKPITKSRTKVKKRNDSIISSRSKIKVFFKLGNSSKKTLAIKEEVHFDFTKDKIPLKVFSFYMKEISNDIDNKAYGLMTNFKTIFDGDVSDQIELNLVSVKTHNLKIVLNKMNL